MQKVMTVRRVDGKWFKVEEQTGTMRKYPAPVSDPIFNNGDILTQCEDEDLDGFDIEMGIDGKWYEVNDAQTPMFYPIADTYQPGFLPTAPLLSGPSWLTEAIESGLECEGFSKNQPVEEVVMMIMGFARHENVKGITIEMVDRTWQAIAPTFIEYWKTAP